MCPGACFAVKMTESRPYTFDMRCSRQALILIAVMFWQSLAWATPHLVAEQVQRLAHVMAHEEVVDHHHHNDESVHVQNTDSDAIHLHADSGFQPVGLAVDLTASATLTLPALLPRAVVACQPSVCIDGLLRPPQAAA